MTKINWPEKKESYFQTPVYKGDSNDAFSKGVKVGLVDGWNDCLAECKKMEEKKLVNEEELTNVIKNVSLTDKSRKISRSWNLTRMQARDIAHAIRLAL